MRAIIHEYPAIVKFDLLLFIKTSQIVKEHKLEVVMWLGGFHFLKSFLGCIGYILVCSCLAEAMGVVYVPNTVKYILKGEAYSKALRAHFLTDAALLKNMMSATNCTSLDEYSRTCK